jgi:hypothetical protein
MRKCAQNEIVGVKIVRPFAFDVLDLRGAQARLDRANDRQSDLVLQREYIVERTVIALGPKMRAGLRLDELCGDADTVASLSYASPKRAYRTPSSRPTCFMSTVRPL